MSKYLKSSHDKNKKSYNKKYEVTRKQKKRNEEQRISYLEKISNTIHIPSDILAGAPIITATGRNEVSIENYSGIIEYNNHLIKIQTKMSRVHVEGNNLNILYFTEDEMKITGYIKSISYQ